jgi:hypothetical protein
MIGGCRKTFARRDAARRHLDNPNLPYIGDMDTYHWWIPEPSGDLGWDERSPPPPRPRIRMPSMGLSRSLAISPPPISCMASPLQIVSNLIVEGDSILLLRAPLKSSLSISSSPFPRSYINYPHLVLVSSPIISITSLHLLNNIPHRSFLPIPHLADTLRYTRTYIPFPSPPYYLYWFTFSIMVPPPFPLLQPKTFFSFDAFAAP